MNYKKGNVFVIFLVVILLISVLAVAYFYLALQGKQRESFSSALVRTKNSQSPDVAANWGLFSNSDLGISFKYPPKYSPQIEGTRISISVRNPAELGLDEGPLSKNELDFSIIVTPANGKTTDELANEIKLTRGLPSSDLQAPLIDGVQSVHFKWTDDKNDGGEAYIVVHGIRVVTIYKYPIVTEHQDNFDKILTSFRFIN